MRCFVRCLVRSQSPDPMDFQLWSAIQSLLRAPIPWTCSESPLSRTFSEPSQSTDSVDFRSALQSLLRAVAPWFSIAIRYPTPSQSPDPVDFHLYSAIQSVLKALIQWISIVVCCPEPLRAPIPWIFSDSPLPRNFSEPSQSPDPVDVRHALQSLLRALIPLVSNCNPLSDAFAELRPEDFQL